MYPVPDCNSTEAMDTEKGAEARETVAPLREDGSAGEKDIAKDPLEAASWGSGSRISCPIPTVRELLVPKADSQTSRL